MESLNLFLPYYVPLRGISSWRSGRARVLSVGDVPGSWRHHQVPWRVRIKTRRGFWASNDTWNSRCRHLKIHLGCLHQGWTILPLQDEIFGKCWEGSWATNLDLLHFPPLLPWLTNCLSLSILILLINLLFSLVALGERNWFNKNVSSTIVEQG